jgi:hypothetical protein
MTFECRSLFPDPSPRGTHERTWIGLLNSSSLDDTHEASTTLAPKPGCLEIPFTNVDGGDYAA